MGAYVIQEKYLHELNENTGKPEKIEEVINEIKFEKYFNDSEENRVEVRRICKSESGMMWVSCNKGLIKYDPETHDSKRYRSDGSENSMVCDFVHFVKEFEKNKFFVGTDRGIDIFYADEERFEQLTFKDIYNGELDYKGYYDAEIDEKGRVWLGLSEGIILGDKVDGKYNFNIINESDRGLSSKIIRDIYIDKSGLIWIGTKFGGLNVHNVHKHVFKHRLPGVRGNDELNPEDNFVLTLYEDKDHDYWIGTKYSGLLKYDFKKDKIKKAFNISSNDDKVFASRVESIYQVNDGRIITGTPRGISVYDKKKGWVKNINFHRINCFFKDSEGRTWVGSISGIYLLDEKNMTLGNFASKNNAAFFNDINLHIYRVIEDDNKNLWIGTRENGIYIYNMSGDSLSHHLYQKDNEGSLSGDMVRDILQDNKGRVWVTTKHAGICYYDPDKKIYRRFTKMDGLPSNTIYSIAEDKNHNLWLGTHHGLSKLDIETLGFTNFDISHGLQSNIFENDAQLVTSEGVMMFGGKNGFNIFNPDSIKINEYQAPLIISWLNVNDRKYLTEFKNDTSIVLSHNQNYLSFEFIMLDYRNPSRSNYRYMMEGVDKSWIESGTRNYISYPKLENGDYVFKVLSQNRDNNWSDTISIKIKIKPPFWETRLAYFIYAIMLFLFLYILYYLTNLRINYVNNMNDAKLQVQRSIDLNRIKLHFFTNISHELRTPLSLILAPIENLKKSNGLSSADRKNVDLLNVNTKRLFNLINQLLYFRKTEQTNSEMKVFEADIVTFIKEISVPYNELAEKKDIVFNIKSGNNKIMVWFDPDKMEKIISNLLMNALKFTPSNGNIEISFSTGLLNKNEDKNPKRKKAGNSGEAVKISVSDTGSGMTREQMKYIFDRFYVGEDHKKGIGVGLELARTLAELHGGKITVESEQGKGSTFSIWLQLGNSHFKKEYLSEQEIRYQDYISEVDQDVFLYDIDQNIENDGDDNVEQENGETKPLLLIVDDNKDLRYFLSLNLSDEFKILNASDGVEGLNMARENIPELILSDVMMPEMDGIEMCKYIKSDITTCHIPVILLTAKTHIENKLEGMAIGADDYIEKPFNFQFLQLRIRNQLRSRSRLREQVLKNLSNGNSGEELKISEYDKKFLSNCKEAIEQNFADSKFSVVELSKFVGMSRSQLHRKLKALTGNSPIEWIYNYRLTKANEMLQGNKYNVSDVAYLTGFNSPSSFSTVFRKKFGLSPSEVLEK